MGRNPLIREGTKTVIDSSLCNGCGLCAQVCPYKAIVLEKS